MSEEQEREIPVYEPKHAKLWEPAPQAKATRFVLTNPWPQRELYAFPGLHGMKLPVKNLGEPS